MVFSVVNDNILYINLFSVFSLTSFASYTRFSSPRRSGYEIAMDINIIHNCLKYTCAVARGNYPSEYHT